MDNTKLAIQDEVLPAISDDTLIALAEQAEKRIEAMNKIKNISLRLTNRNDWVDQNGKPYCQSSGLEKIARMFGISWRMGEPILEQEEGGHYNYTYKGEFSLAGASIEAIGTRSSKDGFFKKYSYPNGKERVELPPSEIDKGDVKKSAYTNLLANGISRLLGLRNITYEELEQYAHITKSDITKVAYKTQPKPPPDPARPLPKDIAKVAYKTQPKPPPDPARPLPKDIAKASTNSGELASDKQLSAIFAIQTKMNITDDLERHENVSRILEMPETITSLKTLTMGQASTVIKTLSEQVKE